MIKIKTLVLHEILKMLKTTDSDVKHYFVSGLNLCLNFNDFSYFIHKHSCLSKSNSFNILTYTSISEVDPKLNEYIKKSNMLQYIEEIYIINNILKQ